MTCKNSLLYRQNFFCSILYILFFLFTNLSFAQNISRKDQPGDSVYDRKVITDFFQLQASVKYIYECTLDPSATKIAWCADGENGQRIFIQSLSDTNDTIRITTASANQSCNESEPLWAPDGKEIAFLSDAQTPHQLQLFIADAST